MTWTARLFNKSGNYLYDLPIEGLSIDFVLNNIWTANLRVNFYTFKEIVKAYNDTVENALTGGFREVRIYYGDSLTFSGILSEINVSKNLYDINIGLVVKSWLAYFQKRFITKTYSNTDAGQIAWDMINTCQGVSGGNIGITQGTIQATKNRDRTYKDDEIAKSIINLAYPNIKDGFDFEISNTKVFTVKNRLGSDKPFIVFNNRNIENWQVDLKCGLSLCNKVISLGNGIGDDQPRIEAIADSSYINKWYLLEELRNDTGVIETDTLTDKANSYINLRKDYFKTFAIKVRLTNVSLTDFNIGDSVKVEIEDFVNGMYRIYKKSISFSNTDEVINLEFIF
jgi:hypothetical protein